MPRRSGGITLPDERYSRQIAFHGLGEAGHAKIGSATVAIVGLGALGTAAADRLCRAGIGSLRLIDPDKVELSNLQRQSLYTEADIGAYKVEAAALRLHEINGGVSITSIIGELSNAHLGSPGAVADCTDNMAARALLNDLCYARRLPWVHGAAAGSLGVVLPILPGRACFRCLYPDEPDSGDTAATLGMLNSLTAIVGAFQANEIIKIIVGSPSSPMMMFDIWGSTFEFIDIGRNDECPVCGGAK